LLWSAAVRIFNVETQRKDRPVRVTRWGNSLAVRIPKALAEQTRIEEGSEVELSVADGALTIRPKAHSYSLEELLDQVTPENRHDEIDWGEPQGKEVW
jgi:antitoxin MazE